MSRESRRRDLERRLEQLEHDYTALLAIALDECRNGRWGLFGQNDHVLKLDSRADELISMGEFIRHLRTELGITEPFTPHERFLYYRGLRGPNAPGEPKLAAALSQELKLVPAREGPQRE